MTRPTRYSDGGTVHEVIVVGGGAAGLSAALVLGRAGRCTLVLDEGRPRNQVSPASHGVFTRDGDSPTELLRLARTQLAPYPSVELRQVSAMSARPEAGGFVVLASDGSEARSRRILLAVGVRDELPPIAGLASLWGTGVLHCPFCHAWEVRDEPLAVCANGSAAMGMVTLLLGWSRDLLLCTNGPANLSVEERDGLASQGVGIIETPLTAVGGAPSAVTLEFADGRVERRRALFLRPERRPASDLPDLLGCERTETGLIKVGADRQTSVPGVYAAGDASTAEHQVLIAAASGAEAAMQIVRGLAREDFEGRGCRCLMTHPAVELGTVRVGQLT